MTGPTGETDDDATLRRLGYEPELGRRMGAFSNFALSFSIICILAGGVTSFHLGLLRGRRGGDRSGVAARLPVRAGRGGDHGPGRLGVPDGRRAVSLGGDPRRPRVGLGRGLAQPGGPDRRSGRDRRRGLRLREGLAGLDDRGRRRVTRLAARSGGRRGRDPGFAGGVESPRGPHGLEADGRLGLPDPGRRGGLDGGDARLRDEA